MMRFVLIALAVLSPFLFPYPVTLALSFVASLFYPPLALVVGILTDLLYYVPSVAPLPLAVLTGLALSIAAFFMQRFLKTRIMGG